MKKACIRKAKTKSGQRPIRLKEIGKRLAAYSAAAAATVATTHDRSADAKQVIHDIMPDITIGPQPGILFNVLNGETAIAPDDVNNATPGSMRLVGSYPGYAHPYIYTPASSIMGAFVVEVGSEAIRLDLGAVIGSDGNLTFFGNPRYPSIGNYAGLPNWGIGDTGFAGFRFELAGELHFGWAEVTRISSNEVTLHSFGYNDEPGEPAIADPTPFHPDIDENGIVDDSDLNLLLSDTSTPSGRDNLVTLLDNWGTPGPPRDPVGEGAAQSVPEPSSLLLLAAGAAGLTMWRRRKRSGQAA